MGLANSMGISYFEVSSKLDIGITEAMCEAARMGMKLKPNIVAEDFRELKQYSSLSRIKMILIGLGGAGKSAMIIRWIRGEFWEDFDPTIEDAYEKTFFVPGLHAYANHSDYEPLKKKEAKVKDKDGEKKKKGFRRFFS